MNVAELELLRQGDVMGSEEFIRRWDRMPDLKRAELVHGRVDMGSPVSGSHSGPHSSLVGWLVYYRSLTPFVGSDAEPTTVLDPWNTLQPDGSLLLMPRVGGRARSDNRGYFVVPPDFVIEVAASQPRGDVLTRFELYCRFGVSECVAVFTRERRVEWYDCSAGGPALRPGPDGVGVYRSRVFPGLWLDERAAVDDDVAGLLAGVRAGVASAEHAAFVADLRARAAAAGP